MQKFSKWFTPHVIARVRCNLKAEMSCEYFFIYDKSGKFIRKSSYQYRVNYLKIYNYDLLGRINKELMINEGIIHGVKKHSFIGQSALIEKAEIASKALKSLFKYKYDEGKLIFETSKSTFTVR